MYKFTVVVKGVSLGVYTSELLDKFYKDLEPFLNESHSKKSVMRLPYNKLFMGCKDYRKPIYSRNLNTPIFIIPLSDRLCIKLFSLQNS